MTEAFPGRNRIFLSIVQARVEEGALAMHFEVSNEGVPVNTVPQEPVQV
jgi:hypothetical protein